MTATISSATTWFVCPKPESQARLRLFCFPYAGGGASIYRTWTTLLAPEIELRAVQLPGREGRFRETAYDRLTTLVETLEQQLQPFMDRPFAFFGHSMGALIAFELTRRLQASPGAGPVCLFVSARRAPQLPNRDMPIHQLPQDAFVQQLLQRYSGIPKTILEQPELMALFSQTLRADFALIETYTYTPDQPLTCPITAFGGTDDPHATQVELNDWSAQTSSAFGMHMIPGDHFFLQSNQADLVRLISEVLRIHLSVKNG